MLVRGDQAIQRIRVVLRVLVCRWDLLLQVFRAIQWRLLVHDHRPLLFLQAIQVFLEDQVDQ